MSIALFNVIPTGAIEILFDTRNQPWFKQVHVGEYIAIANMRDATSKIDPEDKKSRAEITVARTDGSYTHPKHAKLHDDFLSVNGVTTVLLNSRKQRARQVAAWHISEIIPRGFNARIEEHQLAIEDKDAQLALTNDDLTAIQHDLQAKNNEIQQLQQRYVDHCLNPGKDNIIIIIRKHMKEVDDKYNNLPYYIARIQRRKRYVKLRWFERHFPNHEIIVELDNPNSIHTFNRFEEEEHVERKYNHFRLIDLTRDDLYDMGIPAIED